MQENRNNNHKAMGPNKTSKAVERSTKASGGEECIVQNFDKISMLASQTSTHTHKSSESDEQLIS